MSVGVLSTFCRIGFYQTCPVSWKSSFLRRKQFIKSMTGKWSEQGLIRLNIWVWKFLGISEIKKLRISGILL